MKVKPLFDKVLAERIEPEVKTKGGIIIPDTAQEKPIEARVIAVGQGKIADDGKVTPLAVKEGDRILIHKYGGTELKVDGKDVLMLREDDILGVIEK
jgi:chaperonin GroES